MTVIGMFDTAAGPTLFGDLMLSAARPSPDLRLPTIGNVADTVFTGSAHYAPVALGPKVVIISPTLAFAWAGSHTLATAFTAELVALAAQRSVTANAVRRALENINSFAAEEPVTFLVAVKDGEEFQPIVSGLHTEWAPPLQGFRRGWIAGSGSSFLRERWQDAYVSGRDDDDHAAAQFGIASLQAMMTKFEVLLPGATVASCFGGGYEAVRLRGGEFEYVDDNALVLQNMAVELRDGRAVSVRAFHPYKALRLAHWNAGSLVRTVELERGRPRETSLHGIAPFPAQRNAQEWSPRPNDWPTIEDANQIWFVVGIGACNSAATGWAPVSRVLAVPALKGKDFRSVGPKERWELQVAKTFTNRVCQSILDLWNSKGSA